MGNTRNLGDIGRIPDSDLGGLILLQQETITTLVNAVDIDLPSGYSNFLVIGSEFSNEFGSTDITSKVSTDNGSTFISSSYAGYGQYSEYGFSTATSPSSRTLTAFYNHVMPGFPLNSDHSFVSAYVVSDSAISLVTRGATDRTYFRGGGQLLTAARATTLRFSYSVDDIATGRIALYGYKEAL